MLKTYDPKQVSLIVGGKIVSGFGDGTFIVAERNEDTFALKVGVDGEGTRAKTNNKSGRVTVTLMQSSSANDDFSGYAAADEASNGGVVSILLQDNSGRTLCTALNAWVVKMANAEFAKEASEREWIFETEELIMFDGGN